MNDTQYAILAYVIGLGLLWGYAVVLLAARMSLQRRRRLTHSGRIGADGPGEPIRAPGKGGAP